MFRLNRALICLVATCCLSSAADAALRAGAAAVDVSPTKFPVIINGNFLQGTATKLSDPLHARALVFDDGKTQLAICVVDSCLMPRDLLDAAKADASKATGIPAANMLVSATHCHSAPSVMGVLGTDVDPSYPPVLRAGIAKAIAEAHKNLLPARVAWGIADANEYTGVRRWIRRPDRIMKDPFGDATVRANMHPGYMSVDAIGPSGPEDPDLTVLSVKAPDGRPMALLANFGMHYFGGVAPVSADYFGRFCDDVAKALPSFQERMQDRPFVAIMSQGTSGDCWRVDYGKPKPTITIDQYASDLAKLAINAVKDKPHRDVDLSMAATEIKVKARSVAPEKLEWAKKTVAEMGNRLPKNQPEVYAREVIYLHDRPEADMLLQAIRVGDFGITAMPNEVYALTGLKIKAQSPLAATMNIELANDELGYIPPPEQHKLGGYTTWPARSSYTAVDTEPKMVETVLTLLEKVAGKPRREIQNINGDYAAKTLEQKPLAYWRMNEMVAGNARDAASDHTAKYEDGILFWLEGPSSDSFSGKGVVNRSPHFAGGRMVANLGKDLPDSYAAEMWFWNGLAHEARPVTGYLFSRGTDGDKTAAGDHLGIGGTWNKQGDIKGRLIFFNGNTADRTFVGRTVLTPRTWNHVVLVRNANRVYVYLNGQPDPEISADAEPTFGNASTVFIGGRCDNFSNFEGKIDEVAIFPHVLRPDDVAAHFKVAGVAAPPPATQPAATQPTAKVTGMHPSPPKSPEESAKVLHVKDGYVAELVASEPMIASPVAFTFGTDGRLWVVEMVDYPYGIDGKMKPSGRVRYLLDTDGDGKYDKSVVFAENLNFPNGILPWRNGVIVTAAPDILYLEDTKGTGKADKIEVLFTGFTQGNPQLRVNCPMFGLDNWVSIANGLSSKGTVKSIKTGKELQISGHDLRIRPDTGDMELETGQSQFGRRMDDYGDWFGVHNSYPVRHFVIPERYAKRNPHAALPNGQYDVGFTANPKVYPVSEGLKRYGTAFFAQSGRYTSACSVTPYRDHVLFGPATTFGGPEHVFTCEPVHNLVQHNVLTAAGSTFAAERAADEQNGEFLASEDQWFRPVFLASAPDGSLWVADMYRFMIEHPDWLPPEGKEDYRPYYRLGEDRGRIYRVYPKGQAPRAIPNLEKLDVHQLVKMLESPNGPQRDLVQAMLIWRDQRGSYPALETLAQESKEPMARMHALCTLDGVGALRPSLIEKSLSDPHAAVRRQAIRLAEKWAPKEPTLLAAALKLADDPEPKVRLQLAFSIGEWDGDAAGKALVKIASTAGDDTYLAAAVMSSAARHYKALGDAFVSGSGGPDSLHRDLLAMALARNDRELVGKLLSRSVTAHEGRYGGAQYIEFGQFLDLLSQQKTSLTKLAAGGKKDALSDALEQVPAIFAAARTDLNSAKGLSSLLIPSISIIGRDPANEAADAQLLASHFQPTAPADFQSAVVRSLSRLNQPDIPKTLTSNWTKRPTDVKNAIVDAMLLREPWAFALAERIKAGDVAPIDIDAARRQRLLRHASKRVKDLAIAALGDFAEGGRAKVIEAYRPAMTMAGDVTRGQKVFANNCATCHKLAGVGNEIGPNLQSVAGWPADALVTAMLDPSRSAEPRYLAFNCTLDSGEVVYGIVLREAPAGVTMKTLDGQEKTIPRRQIKNLECTNRSLMPDGLEQAVDQQSMADVIAYLKAQKQ
jgi:putative membrane-bound dehydrogenase-like protein